ncbi:MAG: hypothetical protein ACXW20_19915 [Burkholderiales bacterium]
MLSWRWVVEPTYDLAAMGLAKTAYENSGQRGAVSRRRIFDARGQSRARSICEYAALQRQAG